MPYLKFKFLKNRAIDLGNDVQYSVRFQIRAISTPHENPLRYGLDGRASTLAVAPHFFVGTESTELDIKTVDLLDETPFVQPKQSGMNEKMYDGLIDQAVQTALKNKAINDEVRRRVAAYVESGTISVVDDPFAVKLEPLSDSVAK